jgi:hypothetical protein
MVVNIMTVTKIYIFVINYKKNSQNASNRKFFLDIANFSRIRKARNPGLLDGVRQLPPTIDPDGSLPWKRSGDGSNLVDTGILCE